MYSTCVCADMSLFTVYARRRVLGAGWAGTGKYTAFHCLCCYSYDSGAFDFLLTSVCLLATPCQMPAPPQDFFRTLTWWIVPCLAVKVTREVSRFAHILQQGSSSAWTWRACAVLFASVASWTYLTTIILSSCMLFNLVCSLQVIHFDDYGKLLEQDADPLVYLKEHLQLRHNLSKISHRFRVFLLLLFLSVTAGQFAILFKTTAYSGPINFTNGGDIAVSVSCSFPSAA